MDELWTDFYLLNGYVLRRLYQSRASPLAWLIAVDHAQSLDQYRGKVNLNTVKSMPKARLLKITGDQEPPEFGPDLSTLLLISKNKICFSTLFRSEFLDSQQHQPTIIVRNLPAPVAPISSSTSGDLKHEWQISNNLFGNKRGNTGYQYEDAKKVMASIRSGKMDLDGLSTWRDRKDRPPIAVSAEAVRAEYAAFTFVPPDYAKAKVKESTTTTEYRERKL